MPPIHESKRLAGHGFILGARPGCKRGWRRVLLALNATVAPWYLPISATRRSYSTRMEEAYDTQCIDEQKGNVLRVGWQYLNAVRRAVLAAPRQPAAAHNVATHNS